VPKTIALGTLDGVTSIGDVHASPIGWDQIGNVLGKLNCADDDVICPDALKSGSVFKFRGLDNFTVDAQPKSDQRVLLTFMTASSPISAGGLSGKNSHL